MRYGTIENNVMKPAPRAIRIGDAMVCNPTDAQYEQAGYLPVVDERPSQPAPNGYHYEAQGWTERGGVIQRVYAAIQDPPPPPRTFSKLRIVAALMEAKVWDTVKQYIIDHDLYDLYLAAQEFAEDNQYFTQGEAQLQSALGWTDEQVEAVLAAAAT